MPMVAGPKHIARPPSKRLVLMAHVACLMISSGTLSSTSSHPGRLEIKISARSMSDLSMAFCTSTNVVRIRPARFPLLDCSSAMPPSPQRCRRKHFVTVRRPFTAAAYMGDQPSRSQAADRGSMWSAWWPPPRAAACAGSQPSLRASNGLAPWPRRNLTATSPASWPAAACNRRPAPCASSVATSPRASMSSFSTPTAAAPQWSAV
mmetsp:Transcript_101373/g.287276  ORF Transcript_101373/g.287276 Transcript_101373/m.287276 type:complete len:206 (+) Transcript_101373:405-1022(+)